MRSTVVVAFLVFFCVACSSERVTRADVARLQKKQPARSKEAVREATKLSLSGYQGKSSTKGKTLKPSVTRADVAALQKKQPARSKEAVRKATKLSLSGYQGKSTTKCSKKG